MTVYSTPQLDAAAAVAEMLTGRTIAGFDVVATADELLPVFDADDLKELKVNCVPNESFSFRRENRSMCVETCPVNVGVQFLCGPENQPLLYQLLSLLRGIAAVLAHNVPAGLHRSSEDIEVPWNPEYVLIDGQFRGYVLVDYWVPSEASE